MSQPQNDSAKSSSAPNGNSPEQTLKQKPSLPSIQTHSVRQTKVKSPSVKSNVQNGDGHEAVPDDASTTPSTPDPAALRSLRMHAILNPTAASDESQMSRRTSQDSFAGYSTCDSSPVSTSAPLTPGLSLPPMNGFPPAGSRQSLGAPTATIDARKSPFLNNPGRNSTYKAEPSGLSRSLPPQSNTLPPVTQPHYAVPSHAASGKPEDQRSNDAASQYATSQSNSPTLSHASLGQGSRTSPSSHYVQSVKPSANTAGHGAKPLTVSGAPQITLAADSAFGMTTTAPSQATYQFMTLNTDHGPIQVPVDVQAASKVADEKRKRNAGASARFRQRRKEKEREASQMITKLESKVREIGEEKEYYRMERDYFRSLVYNSPAQAHVAPRLPSPRARKVSPVSNPGTSEWQQNGERGSDDGQNQRRRISGYYEGPPAIGLPRGQSPHPQYEAPTSFPYASTDSRAQMPLERPALAGPPPLRPGTLGPSPAAFEGGWAHSRV